MADGNDTVDASELIKSLRYEKDTGKFQALLAQSSTDQQLAALRDVVTDSDILNGHRFEQSNFVAKATMLHDSLLKADPSRTEDLLIPAAANCVPDMFAFMFSRVRDHNTPESRERRVKMIHAAAGGDGYSPEDSFAVNNIRRILPSRPNEKDELEPAPLEAFKEGHKPTGDELFRAIEASIEKAASLQMSTLTEYAGQTHPDIINRPGKDGKTLFAQVVEKKLNREIYDQAADSMAWSLLEAGAKPPETVEGRNGETKDTLVAMLEERFFPVTVKRAAAAMHREVPELPHLEMVQPKLKEEPERRGPTVITQERPRER